MIYQEKRVCLRNKVKKLLQEERSDAVLHAAKRWVQKRGQERKLPSESVSKSLVKLTKAVVGWSHVDKNDMQSLGQGQKITRGRELKIVNKAILLGNLTMKGKREMRWQLKGMQKRVFCWFVEMGKIRTCVYNKGIMRFSSDYFYFFFSEQGEYHC